MTDFLGRSDWSRRSEGSTASAGDRRSWFGLFKGFRFARGRSRCWPRCGRADRSSLATIVRLLLCPSVRSIIPVAETVLTVIARLVTSLVNEQVKMLKKSYNLTNNNHIETHLDPGNSRSRNWASSCWGSWSLVASFVDTKKDCRIPIP